MRWGSLSVTVQPDKRYIKHSGCGWCPCRAACITSPSSHCVWEEARAFTSGWCCSKMYRNLDVTRAWSSANNFLSIWLRAGCLTLICPRETAQQPILIDWWFNRRMNIKQVDSDRWMCTWQSFPVEINVSVRAKMGKRKRCKWEKVQ